jgi:hypothetical protein
MAPRVERKLAAILAADVVGYSRLVGADEAGTIARLKTVRKELIEPLIAEHRGRVVKLTGDGALVEFPSAVHAVAVRGRDPERRRRARGGRARGPAHSVSDRHQCRRHHCRGRRHPGRRREHRCASGRPRRAGRDLRRAHGLQSRPQQARAALRADGHAPGQEHQRAGRGLARRARRGGDGTEGIPA